MNEFRMTGAGLAVTDGMREMFERDGFIIIKGLFNKKEMDIIKEAVQGPTSLSADAYAYGRDDGAGKFARMSLWNNAGSDTTGVASRMRKMAGTAEALLGGEVFHYHGKLIMKDAHTGGKFVWHQDYGYWYRFACLLPHMLTAWLAVDHCDRGNGCLQVLRGSHKAGRIDHIKPGDYKFGADQAGADIERVNHLMQACEPLHCELASGDVMFFHCNLLHTSAQNLSARRRWALLTCYSRTHNSPYDKQIHAYFDPARPLDVLENDALLDVGVNRKLTGKDVIRPEGGGYRTVVA